MISSSIRIGSYLRENTKFKAVSDFFNKLDPHISGLNEYTSFLSKYFLEYGFCAFNAVALLLKNNANNPNAIVRSSVKEIESELTKFTEYHSILTLSEELEKLTEEYVFELLTNIKDFPKLNIAEVTPKLQQFSNELSTSIIRSGVTNWSNRQAIALLMKKHNGFFEKYEADTNKFRRNFPYNKHIIKAMGTYSKDERILARVAENFNLVRFLIKNGIIQGFFYKIIEVKEKDIIKIREGDKENPIHPVVIKFNGFIPMNHLIYFRYDLKGETNYLICRKINMHFTQNSFTTKLSGYRYPTNEYSLFNFTDG